MLTALIEAITRLAPDQSFLHFTWNVKGLLAVQLACVTCGLVGSMIVANRMSFFADALAHSAFAGVALALLTGALAGWLAQDSLYLELGVPLIMVAFGILVSIGIVFVRERTDLANDTVIGVFFAGSIGFGAMIFKAINTLGYLSPENFLFGDPITTSETDIWILFGLLLVTCVLMYFLYNALVFASFSPSLARSRRISQRLCNYIFIALLAAIVNLSLKTVGALLINALLVVPAATAANLSSNLRQMFWRTVFISMFIGAAGPLLSWEISIPAPGGKRAYFGWAGTIVVLSVMLFFASMVVGPWLKKRAAAA